MDELLKFIVSSLVDDKDAVTVEKTEDEKTLSYRVCVAEGDIGKVIGKNGRTAAAIRNVMKSVSAKLHKKVFVKFQD